MADNDIESLDIDVFYSDFGAASAEFAGESIEGLFNKEELQTDTISGVYPAFRCHSRITEGSTVTIDGVDYDVQEVLPLEYGEYLHALSLS